MTPKGPAVPLELVIVILQYAYYKDDQSRDPSYATLATASLVHRTWTPPAQALLFRYVTFDKITQFRHLLNANEHNKHVDALLQHVRILGVGIGLSAESISDCVVDDLPLFLRRCTRLYGLMLHIRATISLEASTFAALKELANRPSIHLRSIEIVTCNAQCPILYQLLSLFPTVRFLSLQCEINGIAPHNVQPRFSLTELRLNRSLPTEVLRWLLSNSVNTLSVLHSWDSQSNASMVLLSDHVAQIHSLRLMIQSKAVAEFVRACQSLVDLTILNLPIFVSFTNPPPSLQYLAFFNHTGSRSLMQRIIAMIPNLPNLKMVTCDSASSPSDAHFPNLEDICRARGIILTVTNLVFAWRMEEPVEVHNWPRRRSISHFSLMS